MYVKMNSGNNTNGILKVWQDDSLVIDRNIQFRANDSLGVSSLMFSTFFGGGSTSYATPVNTSSYFKNLQLSTGDTPITNTGSDSDSDPSQDSAAVSLHTSLLYCCFISVVVLYQFFT